MARKRSGSVSGKVYEALKEQIISLQLPPGQMLVESQLTEKFEVSRTPVREALIKLIHEGLLSEEAGRIYVLQLTMDDVKEIYQIRGALEGLACELAAASSDQTLMGDLEDIHSKLTTAMKENRFSDFFGLDALFHERLVEASGNGRIKQILSDYSLQVGRIRFFTAMVPDRLKNTISEHEEIIRAVASGSPREAQRAVCTHISIVHESIRATAERFGFKQLSLQL